MKYKPKQEIKAIGREAVETKSKILVPVRRQFDLLGASVVEFAFPKIQKLLQLYILILQLKVVVQRDFSKMIMTNKCAKLEPESLNSGWGMRQKGNRMRQK